MKFTRFLGLNDTYHDSSFCFYDAGSILHYEIERFTRLKYDRLNPLLAFPEILSDSFEDLLVGVDRLAVVEGDFLSPLFRTLKKEVGWRARSPKVVASEFLDVIIRNNEWIDPIIGFDRTTLRSTAEQLRVLEQIVSRFRDGTLAIDIVGHHMAHAANAFFSSPLDESLILTLDGGGYDLSPTGDERFLNYGGHFGARAMIWWRSTI